MFYFIIIIILLILLFKFLNRFKVPKIGSIALVTGGVKTGKSNLCVYMAIKEFNKRKRSTIIYNFFARLLNKEEKELPLLYSNIPLGVPYSPITIELLERRARFRYNSVIYISEASLVADSTLVRDMDLNERLLLFNKLIGHETKGGVLIYDTQSICDCHFSIKRCLSNYFYIHHLTKWVPFFVVAHVRELMYSDDNSTINVFNRDAEDLIDKRILIPKSIWRKYDRYCYSSLTDDLPISDLVVENDDLKAKNIVSFKRRRFR